MRVKNKLVYLLCGGLITMVGCKKELDKNPTDVLLSQDAFQTLAHLQLGTNEAYGRYSAYANDMYVNALVSDEAKIGANNAGQGALTYRWQYTSDPTAGGDVIAAYGAYYSMINQVNTVLENIPKVSVTSADEPRKTVLMGQLLALRAIAHFSLLEFYSDRYEAAKPGVPIMLKSDVLGLTKPARNTMGEVVTQIEKDLNDAKALLPAVTAATFTDTVMNQMNITGYQARVALFKRDYQAAVNYATTVINSGVKTLATPATFQQIWTDASTAEILFRRRYSTGSGIGGLWTTTTGLIYIAPSDKLRASYGATDVRGNSYQTYFATSSSGPLVYKFYTSSKGGRVVDIKAMRIAEMYLIRAEAYARLTTPNIAAGTVDLNALRSARTVSGFVAQTFATADALVNAVMDERYKELCFEGFRYFDLKRNAMPIQRTTADANAAWQNLLPTDYRFVMPIPSSELLANPNTKQNPGY